jgi:hypothetical protein
MVQTKRKPSKNHLRVVRDDSEPVKKSNRGRKPILTMNQKIKRNRQGKEEYNYIYSLVFDFKSVVDHTWNIDVIDLSIFYAIRGIIMKLKNSKGDEMKAFKYMDLEREWYYVSEDKIIRDLPLLNLSNVSAVRKRIKKLTACGLIERNHRNEILRKQLIDLGHNSPLVKGSYSKG